MDTWGRRRSMHRLLPEAYGSGSSSFCALFCCGCFPSYVSCIPLLLAYRRKQTFLPNRNGGLHFQAHWLQKMSISNPISSPRPPTLAILGIPARVSDEACYHEWLNCKTIIPQGRRLWGIGIFLYAENSHPSARSQRISPRGCVLEGLRHLRGDRGTDGQCRLRGFVTVYEALRRNPI